MADWNPEHSINKLKGKLAEPTQIAEREKKNSEI